MIPEDEELIKFIKGKKFANYSLIAKHFNIKNATVSDVVKSLEEKGLVEIIDAGGSKMVRVKENKMKKRGQVTLYIILGLVVLIALVAVFSLQNYIIKNNFEREAESIQVLEEFKPVKTYLDSCIQGITLQGAELMGLQGGYINLPEDNLPVNPAIPFSNKLDLFGNRNLLVPYWSYETSNGIQKMQIPSLQDMQNQLADHINLNLNNCLDNFTAFEGYETIDFRGINTSVEITDNKIFVRMLTSIKLNYQGTEASFDKFLVSVDSPLGKLYRIGKNIFNKQNDETFFEQKTIDMLALYDELPYSGTSFSCSPRTWFAENIKKDIKGILKANVEAVNPRNTGYFKYDSDPENSIVEFRYDEQWPIDLSINGGEQVLKEESAFGQGNPAAVFLSTLFCLNNYHFVYDIKYPVLVSLNENGFFFQYPVQIIIKNNQPKENKLGADYIGNTESRVCSSPSTKTFVNAYDSNTGNNIENAKIDFSCVGAVCDLGQTGKNGLSALAPTCVNAVISASKEGYHKSTITLDTIEENLVNIALKPYQKKQVEIKIIEGNLIRNPKEDEFITFNLANNDENYNIFINKETNEINLLPGKYNIQSFIVKDYANGLKLDKQSIEYCQDLPKQGILGIIGLTEKKCFETELEETELEKVIVGGVQFDWEINEEELNKANKIMFYAIYNKVPGNMKELTESYQQILKNADSTNFREPLLR